MVFFRRQGCDEAFHPPNFGYNETVPIDSEAVPTQYPSFSPLRRDGGYVELNGQYATIETGSYSTPGSSQQPTVQAWPTCDPHLRTSPWDYARVHVHNQEAEHSQNSQIAITAYGHQNLPFGSLGATIPIHADRFSMQKSILPAIDGNAPLQRRDDRYRTTYSTPLAATHAHEVSNTAPTAVTHQSLCTRREYTFVPEDPSRKSSTKDPRPRKGAYDEEHLRKQQALKEVGGSCLWCSYIKKGCDDNETCSNCARLGLPCLRSCEQIWLYMPVANPALGGSARIRGDRQKALNVARSKTFAKAQKLAHMLHSQLKTPIPTGHTVLQCRWHYPNLSGLIVLDPQLLLTPLENYHLPEDVKESLIKTILSIIPEPDIFDSNNTDRLEFRRTSIKMLGIATFIISAARSELFVRPSDLSGGRVAFVYLLTHLVQILAQLSEEFSVQLLRLLRPKKPQGPVLDDVFLTTGIYYRVLSALHWFQPGPDSMIEEIFSAIREQLDPSISMIEAVLRSDDFVGNSITRYSKMSRSVKIEKFWSYFDERVPPLPILEDMQISLYLYDKFSLPVPTALSRHFHPFGYPSLVTVPHLLSFDFNESSDFPAAKSPPVPGPDVVSFTDRLQEDDFPFLTSSLGTWADSKAYRRTMEEANKTEDEFILSGLDTASSSCPLSNDMTLVPTESSALTIVESSDDGTRPRFKSIERYFDFDGFLSDYGNQGTGAMKRAKSPVSLIGLEHAAKRTMYELDI